MINPNAISKVLVPMPIGIIPAYAGIGNLPKTNKHNAVNLLNHYVILMVHLALVTDIVFLRDIYINLNVYRLLITSEFSKEHSAFSQLNRSELSVGNTDNGINQRRIQGIDNVNGNP